MTTLADKSLLSGGDNKPPMLEKHLYDSWKSRMELYMMNRPHGRMILASVEKGPLVWPSITEDGVTRLKEYVELTPAEAIQADCDIKSINIILQGLPTEKDSLMKTVSDLKNDLKMEENRNIDREIALEKKIKQLDNIIFKRGCAESWIKAYGFFSFLSCWGSPPKFDESFHEAWDRYKDLLRACPHHGFTELHQLDTFYNALNPSDQDSLNSGPMPPSLHTAVKSDINEVAVTTRHDGYYLNNFQANPHLQSSVKAVEEALCYLAVVLINLLSNVLATDGNTFPEYRESSKCASPSPNLGASIETLMPARFGKSRFTRGLISTQMTLAHANANSFTDELVHITFPPGNDDLPFDAESDLRELEYLLNHDPIKEMDSILEDSVDENSLDEYLVLNKISEMFINEHALDYSSPPLWDEYDDELFDLKTINDDTYDDPFDPKEEKIKDSKILIE
ncbi:hypothetical protein Tco_1273959 [Tanacetum coccineum]